MSWSQRPSYAGSTCSHWAHEANDPALDSLRCLYCGEWLSPLNPDAEHSIWKSAPLSSAFVLRSDVALLHEGDRSGSRARILVVEDEVITAEDLRQSLEEFGYRVVGVVPSGEEAVAAARRVRPDLLVMDIRLRGQMDGIEAVRRIREDLNVRVVYLTAQSDAVTVGQMEQTQPFNWVMKPFDQTDLHSIIECSMRERNTQWS